MIHGEIPTSVNSIQWQGYRGSNRGIILFYESDPNSELPIRRVPIKASVKTEFDPNYETSTYGLYECLSATMRNAFVKQKMGYLFFMTKYKGTIAEYEGKLLMTGYYRIGYTSDQHKLHLRHLDKFSCLELKNCQALRADEAVFVSAEDAYNLTASSLKSFGYEKKVTKMTKIEVNEETVKKILKKFDGKTNAINEYSDVTQQLLGDQKY